MNSSSCKNNKCFQNATLLEISVVEEDSDQTLACADPESFVRWSPTLITGFS